MQPRMVNKLNHRLPSFETAQLNGILYSSRIMITSFNRQGKGIVIKRFLILTLMSSIGTGFASDKPSSAAVASVDLVRRLHAKAFGTIGCDVCVKTRRKSVGEIREVCAFCDLDGCNKHFKRLCKIHAKNGCRPK